MHWSKLFIPTLREAPAGIDDPGTRLLVRAGYWREGGATKLLLAQRSIAKLSRLVRVELNALGGQEMQSPNPLSSVAAELRSYKQLAQLWYQVEGSRVEICSIQLSPDRRDIEGVVGRVLTACEIPWILAENLFVARSPAGKLPVVFCDEANYAAPLDTAIAIAKPPAVPDPEGELKPERFHTPNRKTIADLIEFTGLPASSQMKTLVEVCDGKPYLILMRGDHQMARAKVAALTNAREVRPATHAEIETLFGASPGSLGPVGVTNMPILADLTLQGRRNMTCGANEDDYHLRHVTPGVDFRAEFHDLRRVEAGDMCSTFPAPVTVELAHCLASVVTSHATGFKVLDESGKDAAAWATAAFVPFGVLLGIAAEFHSDADGLAWPAAIAPFDVVITPANFSDEGQRSAALKLYEDRLAHGLDALLDDRDERPGVKFKDADLIGIPTRMTVGKKLAQGVVEQVDRRTRTTREIPFT